MKNRDMYIQKLIDFKDTDLIKVITGMRRTGKSSVLLLYKEYLINQGIEEDNILLINFESMKYKQKIKTYLDLYNYVEEFIGSKKDKTYVLLDEIQMVQEFEKAVNSFLVDFNIDVYITGSNAYLLSSELSTLLAGRYIEIKMYPLSFKEYIDFNENSIKSLKEKFDDYLKYGGLPTVNFLNDKEEIITTYLKDIYNAVVFKDVVDRNNIGDIALLNNLIQFIAQNTACIVSSNKIANYLKSDGIKTTHNTINNYLSYLENAYIIYKINRYDIKGKALLSSLGKYYMSDMGIRNAIVGYRDTDYGHVLENIVYLELLRRGYDVYIGKNDEYEVDFIATKESTKKYYQVAYRLSNDETMKREIRSLDNIADHYEKTIITYDDNYIKDVNGIKFINIIDFLILE